MYGARQLATEQPQLHYATTGAHGSLRCHRVATLSARPVLPRCRTGSIGADRHRPAQPTEQETATPTGAVRRSRLPAEPSERRSTWQATQEGIAVSRGWAAGG